MHIFVHQAVLVARPWLSVSTCAILLVVTPDIFSVWIVVWPAQFATLQLAVFFVNIPLAPAVDAVCGDAGRCHDVYCIDGDEECSCECDLHLVFLFINYNFDQQLVL